MSRPRTDPTALCAFGSVTQADRDIGGTCDAGAAMGGAGYNLLVDVDFSGDLDAGEVARCEWRSNTAALDAGAISRPDVDTGPWSCAGYHGSISDDARSSIEVAQHGVWDCGPTRRFAQIDVRYW